MKRSNVILVALLAGTVLMVGCVKKVKVTIMNHSPQPQTVQLTVPDGTMTVGTVSAGGSLSHTLKVKTEDLPAQCNYSITGSSLSFTVDEDSPGRWWFHITKDGRITGPYGKKDTHVETEHKGTIKVTVPGGMVVE